MTTVTNIHEHAESMLTTAIEADDWDEMPILSLLFDAEDPTPEHPVQGVLMMIADSHPADAMMAIGKALLRPGAEQVAPMPTTHCLGISLYGESWIVKEHGAARATEIQEYMAAGGKLRDLPEAIEAKHSASFDGEEMRFEMYERGGERSSMPYTHMEGRVVDAIRMLWGALMIRENGGVDAAIKQIVGEFVDKIQKEGLGD